MNEQEYSRIEQCKSDLELCREYLALMQLEHHFTDRNTRERTAKVCQQVQQELTEIMVILEH